MYRDRDYVFGEAMLSVRTMIRLTQTRMAQQLGVSRKTVGEWETGLAYPKAEHLKAFITLAVEHRAFPSGREAEQIRTLWQAAQQKVPLDEAWLATLLPRTKALQAAQPQEEMAGSAPTLASAESGPRVDWGDAPAVASFYGRERELDRLTSWVVQERCRVVSVLGLGGIGKSMLVVRLMHEVVAHFQVVIWRSLRDAPACEVLLDECLQVLAPQALPDVSLPLEKRLSLLLESLRRHRVLLVLDNLETVLEEGQGTGQRRPGYQGYARLLHLMAETEHQSCLLLTSREKPSDLEPQEGHQAPVRVLRLARLDIQACKHLLAEKEIVGSAAEQARLIEAYAGNPLALRIVSQTIVNLFDGAITPFLEQGEVIFGGVRQLLDEQYARLAVLELAVLRWLAIMREPVTINALRKLLVVPRPARELLEVVEGLLRRSLVERGQQPGSLMLQSVVLEYVTTQLVAEAYRELDQGQLIRLREHGLCQAHTREYVRQAQERLLLAPVLAHLYNVYLEHDQVDDLLCSQLGQLRQQEQEAQGYGPTNLVALLRMHRGNLRSLDLSNLWLRGAYLQGVEMQDTILAGALLQDCAFTEAFDATWAVAASKSGQYWASGSKQGEVRVWDAEGQILHWTWQAHTDIVSAIAFSPDSHTLVSGSVDGTLKLWDINNGALLWSSRHANNVNNLAFAPDGNIIASAGNDAIVRLWDPQCGTPLDELQHPTAVFAVTWSPNGRLLASGDYEGHIRLWEKQKTETTICIRTLEGHTNWVRGLAFSPHGRLLASGSYDGTVKLWDVVTGSVHQTLIGHTDRVQTVAWSPDGRTLVSSGLDRAIWLWNVDQGKARAVLHGHTAPAYGLTFTPDGSTLLSGSDDSTIRVWDVERSQCIRVLQGYASALYDIDWSPEGTQIASAGTDALVTIWDAASTSVPLRVLRGHSWVVFGVRWSPDGSKLASSGWDGVIHLWNPTSGAWIEKQQVPNTFFYGLTWSPDGQHLISGTYLRGVLVWEVATHSYRWIERELPVRFLRIALSPEGTRLASGGSDGYTYISDVADGTILYKLAQHQGSIMSVAWNLDGTRLVSGSHGGILVWNAHSGECVQTLTGSPGLTSAVCWGTNEESADVLISGGSDGTLCWWDVQSGKCLWVRQGHQGMVQSLRCSPDGTKLASCGDDGTIMLWDLHSGEFLRMLRRDRPYERLNITGITGLSETQKETLRVLGAFEKTSNDLHHQSFGS